MGFQAGAITPQRAARGLVNFYRREVLRDAPLLQARRWFRDRGDTSLRLDYPLDEDSIVVDLGAYTGEWGATVAGKFGCHVHGFEPIPRFFAACRDTYSSFPKAVAHPYGLAASSGFFAISDAGDASSFIAPRRSVPTLVCETRAINDAFDALGFQTVDLLKINIEGGEYDVLPALMESGWLDRIRYIQVQFHALQGAAAKRDALRTQMSRSHHEQWCYPFVWESWHLKSDSLRR